MGVVTGIPMEFQFGTNWAQFSRLTGGVIGQPLAMEGTFSFFLTKTRGPTFRTTYCVPSPASADDRGLPKALSVIVSKLLIFPGA
jgi:hypothetical protein